MNSFPLKSLLIICGLFIWTGLQAQTVRIMPLGNSITYDHNSYDVSSPRPNGDRISYRYKLSQLLQTNGFDFDFVGSEDGGNNYFMNSDLDDNAGFPGIETWELANLISSGYNGYTGQYVAPGPYLNYFPTDIILLHIGTNNLITSAGQVEDILDNIRFYDNDVIILVARIINRASYDSNTATFNNNVALMVNSRGDSKIEMVNIETGASINYSTDMVDNLHPNQSGYDKIGIKWYDALIKLNEPPVISSIPPQNTDQDVAFTDLNLDHYVSDVEDADFLLGWSYEQELGSRLTISIDAGRVMHITPSPGWSGTETISLKTTDTGSGAFPRSDEINVVFNVDHVNEAPVIISYPETSTFQGNTYEYIINATDVDDNPLTYSAIENPEWMTFNPETRVLSGIPQQSDIGFHDVILRVTDGIEDVDQEFSVEVIDSNDPPEVTSPSYVEMLEDMYHTFTVTAEDLDGDMISYEVSNVPSWLSYNSVVHTLSGRPGNEDVGIFNLNVMASDGEHEVYQTLRVEVVNVNDLPIFTSTPIETATVGVSYIYRCMASDMDKEDVLVYSMLQIPDWLAFTTSSKDALMYGVPEAADVGGNLVIIKVEDGTSEILQAFTIKASYAVGIEDIESAELVNVYPNPADNTIHFNLGQTDVGTIQILNSSGMILLERAFSGEQVVELDITDLPTGFYFFKVRKAGVEANGKFIKN